MEPGALSAISSSIFFLACVEGMTRIRVAKLLCQQPCPAPSWHHPYHPSCLPSLPRETAEGRFAKRWSENPNGCRMLSVVSERGRLGYPPGGLMGALEQNLSRVSYK
eukprot:s1840_g20.t1